MAVQFPKRPNQDRGVIGRQPPPVPQNPYAAPTAELDNYYDEGDYHTEPFYSQRGRIGRIRYLAYGVLMGLCFSLLMSVLGAVVGVIFGQVTSLDFTVAGLILYGVLVVGQLYVAFVPSIRRLNDLNRTGWLSLLLLVPVVNFLLWLYLVFARGDEGYNDYGAPAEPPTMVMYILAFIVPLFILAILGILMAIALPAYQDYVMRTQMGM